MVRLDLRYARTWSLGLDIKILLKTPAAMLSGDEPLQAVAHNMNSANHNKLVKYDGDVVLWQGVNRIQADRVEIDRDKRSFGAPRDGTGQMRSRRRLGAAG